MKNEKKCKYTVLLSASGVVTTFALYKSFILCTYTKSSQATRDYMKE